MVGRGVKKLKGTKINEFSLGIFCIFVYQCTQLACFTVHQLEDERTTGDNARSSGKKIPDEQTQIRFYTHPT